jgi:DNA-binding IclR family transcriptional regulator
MPASAAQRAQRQNLRADRYDMVFDLLKKGPKSVAEVAVHLNVHRWSAHNTLRQMEKMGHVTLLPDSRPWQYTIGSKKPR